MKNYEYENTSTKADFKSDEVKSENSALSNETRSAMPSAGGRFTAALETQAGKMPWVSWVGLAGVSMIASATFVATRKKDVDYATFVGQWAPCFLLLGIYNKLIEIDKRIIAEHGMPAPRADIPISTAYLS